MTSSQLMEWKDTNLNKVLLFTSYEARTWKKRGKFETYGNCFVCGEKNPGGLQLSFQIDEEKQTLKTIFVGKPVFQGYDGIVHGGIVSTLLDEAMAKLAYELGYNAVYSLPGGQV